MIGFETTGLLSRGRLPGARASTVAALGVLAGLLLQSKPASAQPLTERTPNLAGPWVGSPWNLHFQFAHRFETAGQDADIIDLFDDARIVNYPTFDLALGLPANLMAGVRYSSRSLVATGQPNEWQPYLRWSPIAARGDPRAALSATGAWNTPNESFDGEVAGQLYLGPVFASGAVRGFSQLYGDLADDPGGAVGVAGGLGVRLNRYVTLAGDVADVVSGGEIDGESPGVGWSAGLHLGLPFTPHTFSIMATNVSSGTLQGVAGIPFGFPDDVYWGFEFTVPFSGFARWGRIFDPEGDADDGERRTALAAGDAVVEIGIRGISFGRERIEVPAGTTVRWVNRDPVAHTSTSDDDLWGSRAIGPGETFERTFDEPGEFGYHCIPHPFMRGTIVVTPG